MISIVKHTSFSKIIKYEKKFVLESMTHRKAVVTFVF